MPTVAQIENGDPLTAAQAASLIAKVRASEAYLRAPHLYPGVDGLINGKVSVDDIPSRHLSALSIALDQLGDGTVALSGGSKGVNYSQTRDREALVREVLSVFFDLSGGSGTVFLAASARVNNRPEW